MELSVGLFEVTGLPHLRVGVVGGGGYGMVIQMFKPAI